MDIEQQKTSVRKCIYSVSEVLETVLMGEWLLHYEDVFCPAVSGGNSSNLTFEFLCPTISTMLIWPDAIGNPRLLKHASAEDK